MTSSKVVIVTGVSRGIGRATVLYLLSKGVSVVGVELNEDGLQKLVGEIEELSYPVKFIPVVGDITDEAIQHTAVDKATEHGTLVALVNNAAIVQPIESVEKVSLTAFEAQLRLNVVAPLALIQKALPHLRAVSGRIINISSDAGKVPIIAHATYGSTKAALSYITSVLAIEEPNITTVAYHPGIVDTYMCSAMEVAFSKIGGPAAKASSEYMATKKVGANIPGKIIGNLALNADHSLSGKHVSYDLDDISKYTE